MKPTHQTVMDIDLEDHPISCNTALLLPEPFQKCLPSPLMSVMDRAETSFSKEAPTASFETFRQQPLPPPKYVDELRKVFINIPPSDAIRSIVDWNHSGRRFPLYAVTYWQSMRVIIEKRATWTTAIEWLKRWAQTPAEVTLADRARDLMGAIGWGASYTALGASAPLSRCVELDDSKSKSILVASLCFQHHIEGAYQDSSKRSRKLLEFYKSSITENKRSDLYFPVNLGGVHWIAVRVDYLTGDSMSKSNRPSQSATKLLRALQEWLRKAFGSTFRDEGNVLAHGFQEDGVSCGVCTINTIAHNIFGDLIFTPKTRRSLRISYFNTLMKARITIRPLLQLTLGPTNLTSQR